LLGRNVITLEDSVGLIEANGYAYGQEAGEEDEGLAPLGHGTELVRGGGIVWRLVYYWRSVVGELNVLLSLGHCDLFEIYILTQKLSLEKWLYTPLPHAFIFIESRLRVVGISIAVNSRSQSNCLQLGFDLNIFL
jgi:hypothetical protein